MKFYAIQSKNGIMMNACVTVYNRMIVVLVIKVTGGILVNMIVSVIKQVQFLSI